MLPDPLTSIAATGFAVAFFHASLPTHWLPFVLVGRARNWSRPKTVAVTLIAGTGHVLLTSLLGLGIVGLGFHVDERLERAFPWMAGGVLLAMGCYYTWLQFFGASPCRHFPGGMPHGSGGCCRHEPALGSDQEEPAGGGYAPDSSGVSDRQLTAALFMMLAFSPCEGFLPIYLSGVPYGWPGFLVLSAILAVATLFGMLLFTASTFLSVEDLRLPRMERYNAGMLGALFGVLGLAVIACGH